MASRLNARPPGGMVDAKNDTPIVPRIGSGQAGQANAAKPTSTVEPVEQAPTPAPFTRWRIAWKVRTRRMAARIASTPSSKYMPTSHAPLMNSRYLVGPTILVVVRLAFAPDRKSVV